MLAAVSGTEVFPSVSRRHPLWPYVDIWTTANRAFTTAYPTRLLVQLGLRDIEAPANDHEGRYAGERLQMVLAHENADLQDMGWT